MIVTTRTEGAPDGDAAAELLNSNGIVLEALGAEADLDAQLGGVMEREALTVKDTSELSRAVCGEAFDDILRTIAQWHFYDVKALHLVLAGTAVFDVALEVEGKTLVYRVEAGAGDVVTLAPGVRHSFSLGGESLKMTGAYAVAPDSIEMHVVDAPEAR